ncbi:MAG TPA: histidine kinase [Opitutaceae bacterium]|nr:histidine kinase [Opitutaceae bacterium]
MSFTQIEINLPASAETHPWHRRWFGTARYWRFQLAGWSVYLACQASAVLLLAKADPPWIELLMMVTVAAAGLLHSHLLRVVLLRLRRNPRRVWAIAAWLLPWCLAQALAMAASIFGVVILFVPGSIERSDLGGSSGFAECIAVGVLCVPLLVCWCGLYFGCLAYRHYQLVRIERLTLDAAVKEAELRALKSQVNPHFLFNSLNSLRALIPEEIEAPRAAVTRLADFLRETLILGQRELVPLARELALVDGYLALEQLRHEERLRVVRDIDPEAGRFLVPPFVLQTLVENAVKYGIGPREDGGTISIEILADGCGVLFRIKNPGTLDRHKGSAGVGLKNARARLQLLFGTQARLSLFQAGPDTVAAEVAIPSVAETATTAPAFRP